jgi:hypothetical protein
MIGAISSTTSTQPVTQSATTQNQNASASKPGSEGGGDSVHLSSAAQAKVGESKSGCSGH